MVDTITLSIPAVDVLGERLDLGVRQYPFEIPRLGGTPAERSRIEQQVGDELEAAGLSRAGRPEPEVEDALYLLSSSEVSVAAAGLLDVGTGQWLAARVVATGEVGVLGLITGRGLRMEFMSPENLPRVCADLLPQAPPGAGDAVSVPMASSAEGYEHNAPGAAGPDGMRSMEAINGLARYRIGHYVITGTDRRGRGARLPSLVWFDTEHGRYTLFGDRSPEGVDVLTCTPVDRQRLVSQITGLLDRARLR